MERPKRNRNLPLRPKTPYSSNYSHKTLTHTCKAPNSKSTTLRHIKLASKGSLREPKFRGYQRLNISRPNINEARAVVKTPQGLKRIYTPRGGKPKAIKKVSSFVNISSAYRTNILESGLLPTTTDLNTSSTSASTPHLAHKRLNSYKIPQRYVKQTSRTSIKFDLNPGLTSRSLKSGEGKLNFSYNFNNGGQNKTKGRMGYDSVTNMVYSQVNNKCKKMSGRGGTQPNFVSKTGFGNFSKSNGVRSFLNDSSKIFKKSYPSVLEREREKSEALKRDRSHPVLRNKGKAKETKTSLPQHDEYAYESIRHTKIPNGRRARRGATGNKYYQKKGFGGNLNARVKKSGITWKKKIDQIGYKKETGKKDYSTSKIWKTQQNTRAKKILKEKHDLKKDLGTSEVPREKPNSRRNLGNSIVSREKKGSKRNQKTLAGVVKPDYKGASRRSGASQPPRSNKLHYLKDLFSKYKINIQKPLLKPKKDPVAKVKTLWQSNPSNSRYKINKFEKLSDAKGEAGLPGNSVKKLVQKEDLNLDFEEKEKDEEIREERFSEIYYTKDTPKFGVKEGVKLEANFFKGPYTERVRKQNDNLRVNRFANGKESRKMVKKSVYNLENDESKGGIVRNIPDFEFPLKLQSKYKELLSQPENQYLTRILDFGDCPSFYYRVSLFPSEKHSKSDKRFFNNAKNFVNPQMMVQLDTFKSSKTKVNDSHKLVKNLKISNYSGISRANPGSLYRDLSSLVDYSHPLRISKYHQVEAEEYESAGEGDLFEKDQTLIDEVSEILNIGLVWVSIKYGIDVSGVKRCFLGLRRGVLGDLA